MAKYAGEVRLKVGLCQRKRKRHSQCDVLVRYARTQGKEAYILDDRLGSVDPWIGQDDLLCPVSV
jgi:hypothetical protein